jgi:kynurenine formamidase
LKAKFYVNNKEYGINTPEGIDISIPMLFNREQPNIYDVDKARAKAFESEQFTGDTRLGGSCNFEEYKLIPHCNGTHTECVGHISEERISIHNTLNNSFIPSTLITVAPVDAFNTTDNYSPHKRKGDVMITLKSLKEPLGEFNKDFIEGLIIRTLPNDDSKKLRRYSQKPAPYFSIEAMELIAELGVEHLLVDIPSVDRAFDKGRLTNHHIYWNVKQGSHEVDKRNHSLNTITEMIYVPNDVEDGLYLLNLQIAPFAADAAPSRPVIYKIIK